jgi:subtilisin family serine protease
LKKILLISSLLSVTLFADHYFNMDKIVSLTKLHSYAPLKKSRSFKPAINYYKNSSGMRLGVDHKLIINFLDLSIQEYIEKEYSLHFEKSLSKTMYVYSIDNIDKVLEVSNEINGIKGIEFSHPDFILDRKVRSNDPLYYDSWHLDRINIEKAWRYTKGRGIAVGVYDEGIDIEHEDLRGNIIGFGNYSTGLKRLTMINNINQLNNDLRNAPNSQNDKWHGTACAGIIAATGDNELGSVGVAPQAKLIVARYSKNNISDDSKALIDMANEGVSVISNSWGTNNMLPSFNTTLKQLSQEGRDGKGILVFFAAGNDGCNMDKYFEVIGIGDDARLICRDNSSYDKINDESESPYVLSIASSTYNNNIANYSNYGSAIDFVTPGGARDDSIITTDATGYLGFNNSNYTQDYDGFSGTSASAPMAAGIAALVLSVNPNLSKEEVVDILKQTAHKYQSNRYPYDSNGRNDHWGYGMLDAGDAVELALTYGKIQTSNFAKTIYSNLH